MLQAHGVQYTFTMFRSVLPLVQMAQVTLGHPKDVNDEERKKYVAIQKLFGK